MQHSLIHTQPTALAQWHTLVKQAADDLSLDLNEHVESYLIFLLMRFCSQPHFVKTVLATDYLTHSHQLAALQNQALQAIGDKCLLFAGLFPEHAQQRHVKTSYFVSIGQSAYTHLIAQPIVQKNHLYDQLAHEFVSLMDVLQVTREIEHHIPLLSLETAQQLYQDTGSLHALKTLQLYQQSMH